MTACTLLALAASTFAAREVRAEGSAELDARDSGGSNDDDQALQGDTVMRVDVTGGSEKLCWRGTGSLTVLQPNGTTQVATIASGSCAATALTQSGAYVLDADDQRDGVEWDVRVCASAVGDNGCLDDASNERLGRLWSYDWHFNAGNYAQARANNGSVFAIVPGGAADRDTVIEMRMVGVSGRDYHLVANGIGPETADGARVGRSVPTDGHRVSPSYPLYLNPPNRARYDPLAPAITDVTVAADCGTGVDTNAAPATVRFTSNVAGPYVLVCDVDGDGLFDLASPADFSAFGMAIQGTNAVPWNGKRNDGSNAPPDSYDCQIRLDVGEFHYVAQDIETSYPGFRLFRIDGDRATRIPVAMFWDDRAVAADGEAMDDGELSPNSPGPDGLLPGAVGDAVVAYNEPGGGAAPRGNARAWGNFDGDGKGDDAFLDTYAAALSVLSEVPAIRVIAGGSDSDGDGLVSAGECSNGSDPQDPDSDDDGVDDAADVDRLDPYRCRDLDEDRCDDCSVTGADGSGGDVTNDGCFVLALDWDGDGVGDDADLDLDNDGVPNEAEGEGDEDGDGDPNALDRDADGDGFSDIWEAGGGGLDLNGDGAIDELSDTSPMDGLHDALQAADGALPLPDSDTDGVPDFLDRDDDDDGRASQDERADAMVYGDDLDSDGLPNYLDADTDGDTIGDREENAGDGDANDNGIPDYIEPLDQPDVRDTDGDTLTDDQERPNGMFVDTDGDGLPDYDDPDDDDDGLMTRAELASGDSDGDGTPDYLDGDDDGDGVPTRDERTDDGEDRDSDGDGIPNHVDLDDDGDGLPTLAELRDDGAFQDRDDDGQPDHLDRDDDGDDVATRDERTAEGQDRDTDGDGTPDHYDIDDDGDGIATEREVRDGKEFGADVDGDGMPNHVDADADADGLPDAVEGLADADLDGVPDYLDRAEIGYAGGALCAVGTPLGRSPNAYTAAGLLAIGIALRVRRSGRERRAGRPRS